MEHFSKQLQQLTSSVKYLSSLALFNIMHRSALSKSQAMLPLATTVFRAAKEKLMSRESDGASIISAI